MNKLSKVTKMVHYLLIKHPETRNSDSLLYYKVIEFINRNSENPINIEALSVPFFLCNLKTLNFPYFETVRRSRQKVQEKHPELRSTAEVQKVKDKKEKVYREYAKSV